MDLHELERVQRLCILAWMKAVDWEIFKVRAEHKSTSSVHVSPSAGSRQPSEQSHCFVFFFLLTNATSPLFVSRLEWSR